MSLSAKFAQLKKVPTNASNNNGPRARVQQSAASQQTKRAAQNQSRRTGAPVQNTKQGNNKGKAVVKSNRGGKPILNGVKKNLRKNGAKGRPGSAGKKGGKGGDKKEKKTPEDLDQDMAQYWFKAGKGPNPVVAALDEDMDNYFKNKASAAAAPDAATAEPAAVMSE